jgi:putative tryptophan/tyrosine transport system substrate-binding protein
VGRAQHVDRVKRIGILWPYPENDPVRKLWHDAFMQGLAELGWTEGNARFDVRRDPRSPEQLHLYIKELIDLKPDVLVTSTFRLTRAAQQQTKTIPIVLVGAGDPLANGLVSNLSRPDGNTTGITDIYPSIAGKWVELLKGCMPSLARVALVNNPDRSNPRSTEIYGAIVTQAAAPYGIATVSVQVRNLDEIKREIGAFGREPNGGLVILPPPFLGPEREVINRMAVQWRLPVIYQDRTFAVDGGLLSYGADMAEMFRRGGPPYVDRILRGAKPGDLPVQFPTKFTLVVNLKTAKAMGLTISEQFLNLADEVIE